MGAMAVQKHKGFITHDIKIKKLTKLNWNYLSYKIKIEVLYEIRL